MSGEIKKIVFGGKNYPVKKNDEIVFVEHDGIDELDLVGSFGSAELVDSKTGKKFKATFKITSTEFIKELGL